MLGGARRVSHAFGQFMVCRASLPGTVVARNDEKYYPRALFGIRSYRRLIGGLRPPLLPRLLYRSDMTSDLHATHFNVDDHEHCS